jgi:hypothetical protein
MMWRSDPIIGRPVNRHVEEALRHEEFLARWRPRAELAHAIIVPIALALGSVLALMMIGSFVAAIIGHRIAA